jgi:hypothetical protein
MYDRVSLPLALARAGFHSITVVDASRSAIPDWHQIDLDRCAQGNDYKLGSLYVEAVR